MIVFRRFFLNYQNYFDFDQIYRITENVKQLLHKEASGVYFLNIYTKK
jgi:hypothetical protein